jgi:hypothetical protein
VRPVKRTFTRPKRAERAPMPKHGALVAINGGLPSVRPSEATLADSHPDAARVRAFLQRATAATRPAQPLPGGVSAGPSRPPVLLRVPMTCGVKGVPFIGVGEDRKGKMWLIGAEVPRTGGSMPAMPAQLGRYSFDAVEGWACPLCGTRNNPALKIALIWQCQCGRYPGGALHCAGSIGRSCYCACGEWSERHLTPATSFEVQSEAVAPAFGNPLKNSQPATAASPLPRLTWRK